MVDQESQSVLGFELDIWNKGTAKVQHTTLLYQDILLGYQNDVGKIVGIGVPL